MAPFAVPSEKQIANTCYASLNNKVHFTIDSATKQQAMG